MIVKFGTKVACGARNNRVDIRVHYRVVAVLGLQGLPGPELRRCLVAQTSVVGHDKHVNNGALVEKQLHLSRELGNVLVVWNCIGRWLVAKRVAGNTTQIVARFRAQISRRVWVRPW